MTRQAIQYGNNNADFTPALMPGRDANSPIIDMNFSGMNRVIRSQRDRLTALSGSLASVAANIAVSANPVASVGLATVNGSANTYMRSDAAPALSQAIVPTWTGYHSFSPSSDVTAVTLKSFVTLAQTIMSSSDWDVKGAGFTFSGTSISDNTSGTNYTAYAYKAIPDIAGLIVNATYSMNSDGTGLSRALKSCDCGIGIASAACDTTQNVDNVASQASGAWMPYGTAGGTPTIGIGKNSSFTYDNGVISLNTLYTFYTTITVGPRKSSSGNYDITVRVVVPLVSVDQTTVLVDGVVNGAATNGFIAISGNGKLSAANPFSFSALSYGGSTANYAIQVKSSAGVSKSYLGWDGSALFSSATIGSLSGVLKATAGLVSGSATTSDIPEGSNLYYTDARARAAITGTTNRITVTAGVVDISASYVGQASITTLGTIGTGTWNATVIADGKIASTLTGKTYNGLTLTAIAVGFTVAGGTTSKTLTVPLDASVSGTNTGDQTITLTGNLTGSGTGSFVATIASDAVTTVKILNSNVTLAKIANIADQTILGNNTGGSAAPVALTASQTRTVLGLGTADSPTLTGFTISGLTASQAVFTNGSKALVSNALTGTGNVVMSASPTLTGTITASALNLSGDFAIASTLFTVASATGNTIVAGTLDVGSSTPGSILTLLGKSGSTNNYIFDTTSTAGTLDLRLNSAAERYLSLTNIGAGTLSLLVEGRININGSTDTTNYLVNAKSGYMATSASFAYRAFGLGNPGDSNTEYIEMYHDGSATLASINTAKTGTGTVRDLVFRTGGSGRLQISAANGNATFDGDIKFGNVGNGIYIKEGTNGTMGVVTLVLGTKTVSTTKVTANSRIFLCPESLGTITSPVAIAVTARTAGTSFTITSANLTDTSSVAWVILEPA